MVIYTDIRYFFHGLVLRFGFLGWGVFYTPDQPVSYDLAKQGSAAKRWNRAPEGCEETGTRPAGAGLSTRSV
ncbi:hypothetical protein TRIP_B350176 [uncultured Desulfatiglans sp.]|uniref:Uncharacterized protein n=1 Tax=Uncultured Desulfatiglans sp. TaxID=1748965 RepID=A0A653AAQ7_UNCDX|nr:hypothetical protein TRIP_B350176 [uncultured Desulfatiglans sp.]